MMLSEEPEIKYLLFLIKCLEVKMLKINPKLQKHFKNFCYSPQIIMICLYGSVAAIIDS